MDAIAAVSGVSKATIYKHWPNKDALCLEVVKSLHGLDKEQPLLNSGDVRKDIVALLNRRKQENPSAMHLRIMPYLMAYAARNPDFGKVWRSCVMEPPRAQLIELLKRAITQGQLSKNLNFEYAAASLLGPMMYRHVLNLIDITLPADLADQVVEAFWKAHSAKQKARAEARAFPNLSETNGAT